MACHDCGIGELVNDGGIFWRFDTESASNRQRRRLANPSDGVD
jgi:hypothetical protein